MGLAVAAAVDVEVVPVHRERCARDRVGFSERFGADLACSGADSGDREHQQRRGHQPAAGARHVAAHAQVRPSGERERERRPHPREDAEGVVRRGEGDEGQARGRHGDGRDCSPRLGPARPRRQGARASPIRGRSPSRAAPVLTPSVAPGNTTIVRTAAATTPTAREMTTTDVEDRWVVTCRWCSWVLALAAGGGYC